MSHRVSLQVFQNAVKLQLVLFAETGTLEAAHQAVLDKYKGRIIAVRIPLTESGVASWFGVNSANHPAAFLVDTKQPNNYLRYKLDDGSAVTEASMAQFVDDYFAGKLSTHSKSAPKPSEIDVPRTVVASTFKEIVLDTTKDVFLECVFPSPLTPAPLTPAPLTHSPRSLTPRTHSLCSLTPRSLAPSAHSPRSWPWGVLTLDP